MDGPSEGSDFLTNSLSNFLRASENTHFRQLKYPPLDI